MIDQFSHVGIKAEDPQATATWLEDYLNATILDSGEFGLDEWSRTVEFVGLELADKNVFVVDPTPYEAAGAVEEVDEGIAHFGVVVDDANAAIERFVEHGGTRLLDPFTLGDTRYGFCDGPAGVRIEFVEPLTG